jgi:hypothetical protein
MSGEEFDLWAWFGRSRQQRGQQAVPKKTADIGLFEHCELAREYLSPKHLAEDWKPKSNVL